MSDYLNHLVARSLEQVDAIQPRLPSLFEPSQSLTGVKIRQRLELLPSTEEPLEETTEDKESIEQPSVVAVSDRLLTHLAEEKLISSRESPGINPNIVQAPRPQMPNTESKAGEETQEIASAQQSYLQQSVVAPSSPITERSPSVAQPDPALAVFPERNSVSQPSFPQLGLTTPQPLVVERMLVERPFAVPKPLNNDIDKQNPGVVQQQESAIPAAMPVESSNSTSVKSEMEELPILQPLTSTVAASPQITPTIQTVIAESFPAKDKVQTEPTIQVTIGRIEVRATPPTTQPSTRSRPESPVMSLEEYLRQRGGRR